MSESPISQNVSRFLEILNNGGYFEIRALNAQAWENSTKLCTYSGYFNDAAKAAKEIARIERLKPSGVYVTLNPVKREVTAKSWDRIVVAKSKSSTAENHIERRRWLLVDCDPNRISDTSSTDTEMQLAWDLSSKIVKALSARGWPKPMQAMSGNGAGLYYRIDLPNDDDSKALVAHVLEALDDEFSNKKIRVDTSVTDANRLTKVAGTWVRKGSDFRPESEPKEHHRPHRQSWFIEPDGDLEIVPRELLEDIAATAKRIEAAAITPPSSNWSLDDWLRNHHVPVSTPQLYKGGRKWTFNDLPIPCHSSPSQHDHDGSSFLIQFADGKISAGCRHGRCTWKWQDLRVAYEPGCYDKRDISRIPDQQATAQTKQVTSKENTESGCSISVLSKRADLIMPKKVLWWWEDKVPRGILTTIAGIGGLGKSTVTMDLIAKHTNGSPFPGCSMQRVPERAGILNMEDDPETIIVPRLNAAGADLSMVHILEGIQIGQDESWIDLTIHAQLIEDFIVSNNLSLLVIDPVTGHIGSVKQNDGGEVRRALQPVQAIAQRTDCTILCVTHSPKHSTTAQGAVVGSQSFANTSRCVFVFIEDPKTKGRFLMLNPKNNYSSDKSGFAYTLEDTGDCARVAWESDLITDDPNSFFRFEGADQEKQSLVENACKALQEFITEPKPKRDIDEWAKANNITAATLRRAKVANGHEAEKRADGWYWLPMPGFKLWSA